MTIIMLTNIKKTKTKQEYQFKLKALTLSIAPLFDPQTRD